MTRREEQEKSRIPEFASYEEEAEFWDTHSLADYWDEFKPVKISFAKDLTHIIQIPLDSNTMRALSACAQERGVDIITLARQWILEHLSEPEK
jgi:hypothetical protein